MTENKAVDTLKNLAFLSTNQEHEKCEESIEMAIQALEKQIPKKPLHNGANWYRCPNGCEVHKKAFEKDWYCPECGQALDWIE